MANEIETLEISAFPDYFVSYTARDEKKAEWIAYCLEEDGKSVYFQKWDFRPGHNFVLMMDLATKCKGTIAVLSKSYEEAIFTQPEWAACFSSDPTGKNKKLIPVLIEDFKPAGLFKSIVHIDLVSCSGDEERSRKTLLDGINIQRNKPNTRPPF